MKLTKNWLPLLGIYLIVSGLAGLVLTLASGDAGWIYVGLIIGIFIWFIHQQSTKEPERRKRKTNEKNK